MPLFLGLTTAANTQHQLLLGRLRLASAFLSRPVAKPSIIYVQIWWSVGTRDIHHTAQDGLQLPRVTGTRPGRLKLGICDKEDERGRSVRFLYERRAGSTTCGRA